MTFLEGFVDEMSKTAGVGKFLGKLLKGREPGKIGVGKALLGGGGATGIGYAAGKSKGQEAGLQEGMENMNAGMQQAYRVGVQRGAQYVLQRMQQQQR